MEGKMETVKIKFNAPDHSGGCQIERLPVWGPGDIFLVSWEGISQGDQGEKEVSYPVGTSFEEVFRAEGRPGHSAGCPCNDCRG